MHIAFSVLAANIAFCTRVHAALVEAGLVICAFVVGLALGSGSHVYGRVFDATDTLCVRGTKVVGRAGTNGLVVNGTANGAYAAGVDARITAALVVARAISGAIRIDDTLGVGAEGGSIMDPANAILLTR